MTTTIDYDALSALTTVFEAVFGQASNLDNPFDSSGFIDISDGAASMPIILLTRDDMRGLARHFADVRPAYSRIINDALERDRKAVIQHLTDMMAYLQNAMLKGRLPDEPLTWKPKPHSDGLRIDLYTWDGTTRTANFRYSSFENATVSDPTIGDTKASVYAVGYDSDNGLTLCVDHDGDLYDVTADQLQAEVLADICEYLDKH